MIEVKITGNTAEEVVSKLTDLLGVMGVMGGKAAPATDKKSAKGGSASGGASAAALTEEDVRNAWAAKKEKGHDVADLKTVVSSFVVGTDADGEDITAKKISELKPDQYAAAIKAFNALTK